MRVFSKETYINPMFSLEVHKCFLNTPVHLIPDKNVHVYYDAHKNNIFKIIPSNSRKCLPSILSSNIPVTLLKPCSQVKENRLPDNIVITSLRRSHWMTSIDEGNLHTCQYGIITDKYGGHISPYKHQSKTKLHTKMSDCDHFITKNLGPLANFICEKHSHLREKNGL